MIEYVGKRNHDGRTVILVHYNWDKLIKELAEEGFIHEGQLNILIWRGKGNPWELAIQPHKEEADLVNFLRNLCSRMGVSITFREKEETK